MEASAPAHSRIEPEPPEWQPRALWVAPRLLAGAASFLWISFVFAYFYLRSLDLNKSWKIGPHVNPSIGLGIAFAVVLVISAVLMWMAAARPVRSVAFGAGALVFALGAVALQCVQLAYVGFGPANGAYASVFIGWIAVYAIFTLFCAYWIETQVASMWRLRRGHVDRAIDEGVPAQDVVLAEAGLKACSYFWTYYVAVGIITFIILYLV